jgi:tetratricopeptide (TPR) repeat protein
MFEKTPPPAEETVKLSEKEKKKLVEQGVAQYKEGERDQAKNTLEQAKAAFPSNYAVPYYLGLIYLEEGRRSDAIAEWQQYVLMDPKSEDSMKIRKYLTLLIREEAVEYAKQAVANEAALLRSPVADNTVAVTTFENLGSENLEPLGKGMAAMLIHDLSQVPDLQVVERVKLQALL